MLIATEGRAVYVQKIPLASPAMPEKLSRLRQKLGQKAEQQPEFRFYALYDRIYRRDVLEAAWRRVRAKAGGPGLGSVTITAIEAQEGGARRLVDELHVSHQQIRVAYQTLSAASGTPCLDTESEREEAPAGHSDRT